MEFLYFIVKDLAQTIGEAFVVLFFTIIAGFGLTIGAIMAYLLIC